VKRGEIWTVAEGGTDFAGTPRPAVILQDDSFPATRSVTVCGFTTEPAEAPFARITVEPSDTNGLRAPCKIMVDKIMTVRRQRIGKRIGQLEDRDLIRLNRAVLVFLGLAATNP
jgi:mRNA interferase MazF